MAVVKVCCKNLKTNPHCPHGKYHSVYILLWPCAYKKFKNIKNISQIKIPLRLDSTLRGRIWALGSRPTAYQPYTLRGWYVYREFLLDY